MNFALEVFGVREAYTVPYSVPSNDVLSDDGSFELFPPVAPVVVSVVNELLVFQSVENATGYKLLKRVGTIYTVIDTVLDPDATQFTSGSIVPASFFRVLAFNEVGDSPPSNTLYLGHPVGLPLITPLLLDPAPVVGSAFSVDFEVAALTVVLAWSVSSGALPDGLSLDPETGVLSGTPTVSGPFEFTLRVDYTDLATDLPAYVEQFYLVEVEPADEIIILADGFDGDEMPIASYLQPYDRSFSLSGGTGPYAWSIITGVIPSGLVLNSATGQVTGAYDINDTDINYPVTVQCIYTEGTATRDITIWIGTNLV